MIVCKPNMSALDCKDAQIFELTRKCKKEMEIRGIPDYPRGTSFGGYRGRAAAYCGKLGMSLDEASEYFEEPIPASYEFTFEGIPAEAKKVELPPALTKGINVLEGKLSYLMPVVLVAAVIIFIFTLLKRRRKK